MYARHVLENDLKLVEQEARFRREYRAGKGNLQFIKSGDLPHGGRQGLLAWHRLSRRNKILRSMMSSVWECAIKMCCVLGHPQPVAAAIFAS
jgi:hypothetical protein